MAVQIVIDTSDTNTIRVALEINGKRIVRESRASVMKSQMVLPLVAELLASEHLTVRDITGLSVNTGPGSYTGLRVGCAVANMLGRLLDVPVNGNNMLAMPTYS